MQVPLVVYVYDLMSAHFHLLTTEPEVGDPSGMMKVIKERFTRRMHQRGLPPLGLNDSVADRVWQKRFYDFNVRSERKRIEKLRVHAP